MLFEERAGEGKKPRPFKQQLLLKRNHEAKERTKTLNIRFLLMRGQNEHFEGVLYKFLIISVDNSFYMPKKYLGNSLQPVLKDVTILHITAHYHTLPHTAILGPDLWP